MASQFSIPSSSINDDQPISRTYQYRKVMKPMLERKRRARINRCLDEMKELMSSTLAAQGEHISKLEKADVLELTVRHLQKLKQAQMNSATSGNDKYCAGFSQCAVEVRNFLVSVPGIDINVGRRLLTHLGRCAQRMQVDHGTVPAASSFTTPPSSPRMAPLFLQFQKAASAPSSPVDISSSFSPAYSEADALEMMKFAQKSDSGTVGDCKDVWRPW